MKNNMTLTLFLVKLSLSLKSYFLSSFDPNLNPKNNLSYPCKLNQITQF